MSSKLSAVLTALDKNPHQDGLNTSASIFCKRSGPFSSCDDLASVKKTKMSTMWLCTNFVRIREQTALSDMNSILQFVEKALGTTLQPSTRRSSSIQSIIQQSDNEMTTISYKDNIYESRFGILGTDDDRNVIRRAMNFSLIFP